MKFAPRLAATLVALASALALAGEAEWKARVEAINESRMQMRDMNDYQKIQAKFAELATELEAALKEELAKGEGRAETATAAYWLASTYLYLNRQPNAAVLLRIAMEIRVKRFGEDSLPVAEVWDKVAWLGDDQDKSVAMMRRALAIREKVYGKETREIADNLRDIAMNRLGARRYQESEAAYDRAIAITEKLNGAESFAVVEPVSELAWLYIIWQKPESALPLYKRALAITEKVATGDDDRLAKALENLANAYKEAKAYGEAESLYLRAIKIRENLHGPKNLLTITAMGRLRDIYIITGRSLDSWKLGRKIEAAQE